MKRILTRDDLLKELEKYLKENENAHNKLLEELDSWCGWLADDRYFQMNEIDDLLHDKKPSEILELIKGNFNIYDDYFRFTIYGLESTDYIDYSDYCPMDTIEKALEVYNRLYISDEFISRILEVLFDNPDCEKFIEDTETDTIELVEV